jgi:hypothetical protein
MTRHIVVLTGSAGAGKTTVAKQLVADHGFKRVRFAGPLKEMMAALGLSEREIDGDLKDKPSIWLSIGNLSSLMARAAEALKVLGVTTNDLAFGNRTMPCAALEGHTPEYAHAELCEVIEDVVRKGDAVHGATPRLLMQYVGTEWGRQKIAQNIWVNAWERCVAALPEGVPVCVDDCRFPNEVETCEQAGSATVMRIMRETDTLADDLSKAHESESYLIGYHHSVLNNTTQEAVGAKVYTLFRGWVDGPPWELNQGVKPAKRGSY